MSENRENSMSVAVLVEEEVDLDGDTGVDGTVDGDVETGKPAETSADAVETTPLDDESEDRASNRPSRLRRIVGALTVPVRLRRYVATALGAIVVLGVVGLAFLWVKTDDAKADVDAGGQALASVRVAVPKLLSYDHTTIDKTFGATAGKYLTGQFKDDYSELGSQVIVPAAKKDKIVTEATVVDGGVVASTSDSTTLLLFVNQKTESADQQGTRLDGSRVRVEARLVDGTWLIAALTPV